MSHFGVGTTPVFKNRTTVALPHGMLVLANIADYSWTVPDAMVIKQIVVTKFPLQSGNEQDASIIFSLSVEDNEGVFRRRASVTYKNSSPDTSPPPSNPMAPGDSLGEVWDLGLVVLKNTRLKVEVISTANPINPGNSSFYCGIVGTWLRDIE